MENILEHITERVNATRAEILGNVDTSLNKLTTELNEYVRTAFAENGRAQSGECTSSTNVNNNYNNKSSSSSRTKTNQPQHSSSSSSSNSNNHNSNTIRLQTNSQCPLPTKTGIQQSTVTVQPANVTTIKSEPMTDAFCNCQDQFHGRSASIKEANKCGHQNKVDNAQRQQQPKPKGKSASGLKDVKVEEREDEDSDYEDDEEEDDSDDSDYVGEDEDEDYDYDDDESEHGSVELRNEPSTSSGHKRPSTVSRSRSSNKRQKTRGSAAATNKHKCKYAGCGKSFPWEANLAMHERTHLGIKPFSCSWANCGFYSEKRSNVVRHVRMRHFKLPRTLTEQHRLNVVDNRDADEFVQVDAQLVQRRLQ